jgi:hypothetical protein
MEIAPFFLIDPADAEQPERSMRAIGEAILLSRSAVLGEIADAVVFPLGPEASFLTGAELSVDGGRRCEGLYWRVGKLPAIAETDALLLRTARHRSFRYARQGAQRRDHCMSTSLMKAGVMMTMNSTGRKNRIIGTVSFGGRAAAFFSASFMRWSRLSWASVRKAVPSGVP